MSTQTAQPVTEVCVIRLCIHSGQTPESCTAHTHCVTDLFSRGDSTFPGAV